MFAALALRARSIASLLRPIARSRAVQELAIARKGMPRRTKKKYSLAFSNTASSNCP
jgi:hypothetical protein